MSESIAVICEATADARMGCDLADRVICERADWITSEVIDDYRRYRGFRSRDKLLLWKRVQKISADLGIRAHGWFGGQPGALDALATRRALLVLKGSPQPPDAIILLRDSDNQPAREQGMHQARDECHRHWPVPIVIGFAHVMRECWVLVGFLAENPEEQSRLEKLRDGRQLGFDPTLHPERLTARKPSAKQSSKYVLRHLTGGEREREARCWLHTPLATLEAQGSRVGLTSYLHELRKFLVPLFNNSSR